MATEINLHPEAFIDNKVFTMVVLADPVTGLPASPGAGGLSDLVFTDSTGQVFVYRDKGDSSAPVAYKVPEWTVYTPIAPVKAASSQITNFATETGGNLAAINDKIDTKLLSTQLTNTDTAIITNTVIHAWTTSHGGEYVDIKANPSGALVVDTSGSASDALITAGNTTLTEIDKRIGKYANLKLSDIDETTAGTTYLLKQGATSADPWLLMKLVEASGITTARYAGVTNNPTITLATAWANRASLVYSMIQDA
jgi:hypothetical protein